MRNRNTPGGPRRLALMLAALAFAASPAAAQKKVPEGAKVLLLSGGQRQHHGYRDQAFYLSGLLEDTGRHQVTIAEDASILETPVAGEVRPHHRHRRPPRRRVQVHESRSRRRC